MTQNNKPLSDPITGHRFKDPALRRRALTHSSCDRPGGDNQRLEFLGDAVLDLVVAETLYAKFPEADEGALDRARASIVNGENLARAANERQLGKYLEVSDAHRQHHPDPSRAMLEDALEALIGAVYLDGGLEAARHAIQQLLGPQIESLELSTSSQNPKGQLQEWSQKFHAGEVPVYEALAAEGPDHDRTFRVVVFLGGRELGHGAGPSKKSAEARAAQAALKSLSDSSPQS